MIKLLADLSIPYLSEHMPLVRFQEVFMAMIHAATDASDSLLACKDATRRKFMENFSTFQGVWLDSKTFRGENGSQRLDLLGLGHAGGLRAPVGRRGICLLRHGPEAAAQCRQHLRGPAAAARRGQSAARAPRRPNLYGKRDLKRS